MFVDMGPDRIHHGLWKYIDPAHPKYRAGNPFENTVFKYYQFIDQHIRNLQRKLPKDATLIIMSDHGAQAMLGGLCINDWLIQEGYLVLADKPPGVTSLELCEVDWQQTTAWGAGGYYGRIFFNIEGRESHGTIPADEVAAFSRALAARLKAIPDPAGKPLGNRVFRPTDIYAQVHDIPPDLIVYLGDLAWRSVGSVGNPDLYVFENDTGPDDANHAQHGMYLLNQPHQRRGERMDRTWHAVAPTMLEAMGIEIPAHMSDERLHR
jgi:predicted AlkP superfamily phosphohydrolase/phosphomutase